MNKRYINVRKITHEEFINLRVGDIVFVDYCGHAYKSKIIRSTFCNYDSDEPDFEVETTNGFCDKQSLFAYV